MKLFLLLSGLAVVISMGLAVMIFGMDKSSHMILPGIDRLDMKLRQLGNLLEDRDFLRQLLQQQLDKQDTFVKDLDANVNRITSERDKKKSENGACQVEKTKNNEDLAAVEKDTADTEATEKTEREAWTAEVQTLKLLQKEYSKVCDFVKDGTTVGTWCPAKPAPPAVEQPAPPAAEKPAPPAAEQPAPPAAEKPAPPAAEQPAPPAAEKQA